MQSTTPPWNVLFVVKWATPMKENHIKTHIRVQLITLC